MAERCDAFVGARGRAGADMEICHLDRGIIYTKIDFRVDET